GAGSSRDSKRDFSLNTTFEFVIRRRFGLESQGLRLGEMWWVPDHLTPRRQAWARRHPLRSLSRFPAHPRKPLVAGAARTVLESGNALLAGYARSFPSALPFSRSRVARI